MSALPIQQVAANRHAVQPHFHGKTSETAPVGDHTNHEKKYADWIAVAAATSQAASKSPLESPKLDQYLKGETEGKLDPLLLVFKNLAIKLFPSTVPKKFAQGQLQYFIDKYPNIATQLSDPLHETLAIDFFRFCLQAPSQSHSGDDVNQWVDVFVNYPKVAQRLMRSALYEKLGRFPDSLIVRNQRVCFKLNLFNHHSLYIPLDNHAAFRFKNKALSGDATGITLTFEEIFQQFESSTLPDLDVSSEGIINFNSLLLESKDSDGNVHQVEPNLWTEYMPSLELSLDKLENLFSEAASQPAFALVLRVNASSTTDSQTFFDFIKRLPNGKYRMISLQRHQKTSPAMQQQKSYFYPLTPQQADVVVKKVAAEIVCYREAYKDGKPIPPIDSQPYLDDILGHYFYDSLDQLVSTNAGLQAQLKEVKKNLDSIAFKEFLRPVIVKLMSSRDMALISLFINTSLGTINSVLRADAAKVILPIQEDEVEKAAKILYLKEDHSFEQIMGDSLLELAALCFEVLHPYRLSVAAAENDTPVIGSIFRRIESIPWVWLKDLLYNLFLTILGPFRGYRYKTIETANLKPFPRLVQSIRNLVPERYINRPSQAFESLNYARKLEIEALIKTHLRVLTAPAA